MAHNNTHPNLLGSPSFRLAQCVSPLLAKSVLMLRGETSTWPVLEYTAYCTLIICT
jgi:hypothetical protein